MKRRKLVIIRGKITAGKSTSSSELAKVLPGWVYVDIWKIKEMFEPLGLKDMKPTNYIAKHAMFQIIRGVMRKLGRNIVIQESKLISIKQFLRKDLEKYNYGLYSFFLDVDLKETIKRNIQREKKTIPGLGLKKGPGAKPFKGDFVIDTNKNSVKQVVNIILREIGEKRSKHKSSHLIRKTI